MTLSSDDFFLFQRGAGMGNLRRTTIGELSNDMQDTDVFMVQDTAGTGNLRRTTWANRNDLADTVMLAVGSGSELRRTTWGEINGFLGFRATLSATNNNTATNEKVDLNDLFTQEQIESDRNLEITIETGAIVGSNNADTPALNISSSHTINGSVTVVNNGTIIGAGGAAGTGNGGNGGNGGVAFSTTVDVTFDNNGTISGGGGGGAAGGNGGNSSTTTESAQGACCCGASCIEASQSGGTCCQLIFGSNSICLSGFRKCTDGQTCDNCGTRTTTNTPGGNGGTGGRGEGYNQTSQDGNNGATSTAGDGGNGGNGGGIAVNGTNGTIGANGNSTTGTAGGTGGTAGNATTNNGNTITMDNDGTINGTQG